jgi:hypothetical protein
MFRNVVRTLVALAAATTVAFGPGVAQADPSAAATPSAPAAARHTVPVATPRLVDVRFARHRTYDRLVFDFRGGVPDVESRYVRVVREDASGRRVFVPGRFFLLLRFEPARARSFPRGVQYTGDLDTVRGFRLVGDYEGVVHVAVGLRHRVGVRVFELPNRLVVDVPNDRYL